MKNMKFQLGIFLLFFAVITLTIGLVSADGCSPNIKLVNQDPNPATPDNYVKVVFEVTNLDNCGGLSIKLNPGYPFSLDLNESSIQTLEAIPYAADNRNVWMLSYKLRVDSAAFDGDFDLKLLYHPGVTQDFSTNYIERSFNVSIADSRTMFDAVIQETSGNDISIAIANVGKYTANSVVVRIPEQDYYTTTGVDGQMVGNLDSGDYTVVGFTVANKINRTQNNLPSANQSKELQFDVYYTDNIGERRIERMGLPLKINSANITAGNFGARNITTSSPSWYKWLIGLVVLVVAFLIYKKYPQIKEFISSSKKKEDIGGIPDWVKKVKSKEK